MPNNPTSTANRSWQFVLDGWPVIAAVLGLSWAAAVFIADAYVAGIVAREQTKFAQTNPVVQEVKREITSIKGTLENLTGNDVEIRQQLNTVVSRLDTLISIQLSE